MDFYRRLTICGLNWRLYASAGFNDCNEPVWKLHLTNYEKQVKFESFVLSREDTPDMKQHLESVFHEKCSLVYEFLSPTVTQSRVSSKEFDSTTQQVHLSVLSGIPFVFQKTPYNHAEEMAIERLIFIQKKPIGLQNELLKTIDSLKEKIVVLEKELVETKATLVPSLILGNNQSYIAHIGRWLKQSGFSKTSLLYRASTNGWTAQNFHATCDNRGPTLTIIRSSLNYIFGGFTTHPWNSSNTYASGNAHSWLFSLFNAAGLGPIQLLNINANSQHNHSTQGPTFGSGHDFHISNGSNTNNSSYSNLGNSYRTPLGIYGSNEARNFLAGSYNFTVSEIEVFLVHN